MKELTINLNQCQFRKEHKLLTFGTDASFPEVVFVKSHHTGRTIKFVYDQAAAIANEFWDGCQAEYYPADDCQNVKRLVLHITQ